VQEHDLTKELQQTDISQGMFRALSLIIQLTYSNMFKRPSCILIDDIGEGLDYERASALITLLTEKAKDSSVQLIMSTNDRFVMNNVPLEYWSVAERAPNGCRIYSCENAPEKFRDFQLTGLSNFDFFAGGFFGGGEAQR
jgi:predicted ATPase